MKTEVWIARRLQPATTGGRRRGPSRTGVIIAIAGVALALAIMMIAVAVLNGFSHEIRSKVADFEPQITISALSDDDLSSIDAGIGILGADARLTYRPIAMNADIQSALDASLPKGYTASVAAVRPAILKTADDFQGIVFKTDSRLFPDSTSGVALSKTTADALRLAKGDALTACFFIPNSSSPMKIRKISVDSIYDTGFADYDKSIVFAPMSLIASVDGLNAGEGSRIEIRGIPEDEVELAAENLRISLTQSSYTSPDGQLYAIETVNRRGAMYFNWLEMLDTNVTVILLLMGIVAAFTLISSMFVIVLERVRMIGLLKSLGAGNAFVQRIFIAILTRLVIRGLVIGNVIAGLIIILQKATHILRLDPATYFIDHVAMRISLWEILALNLGVLLMAVLVLILPSRIVCGISPARSLRFE